MKELVQMALKAGFSERKACEMLGASRGSCHKKPATKRAEKRASVLAQVRVSFDSSKERYGSPRVFLDLQEAKVVASENMVANVMRDAGLVARSKKRFTPSTTDSKHDHRIAANTLDRNFDVAQPNKVWVGDISYLWVGNTWVYLATVIDLFSRRVIGWTLRSSLHAAGAVDALQQAIHERGWVHDVLVHHDRGVQYACDDYAEVAENSAMIFRRSIGDCYGFPETGRPKCTHVKALNTLDVVK